MKDALLFERTSLHCSHMVSIILIKLFDFTRKHLHLPAKGGVFIVVICNIERKSLLFMLTSKMVQYEPI